MKQMGAETEGGFSKLKQGTPPPPPAKFWVATKPVVKMTIMVSVTNQEIAKFWRQKRMEEEDHLLAAIKAAARIRARKLSEDAYKRFVESLKEDDDSKENNENANSSSKNNENNKELHVGIKDWFVKFFNFIVLLMNGRNEPKPPKMFLCFIQMNYIQC
uniref:Uncharacterized protein n=1 Tax=Davidia involucrata TaxID=16924 RepID=A0A5B6YXR3_DAVIN